MDQPDFGRPCLLDPGLFPSTLMTKKLIYLILLALLIRLGLIYFQFSGDIRNHLVWGESVINAGTFGFYGRHFSGFNDANYPPLTIFVFAIFRYLYQICNQFIIWQNFNLKFLPSFLIPLFASLNMQAAFMKIPAILADLGIGYLIFKLTKKKFFVFLYLFNPAVIYVSTVWGQIESLPIFFLLLSFFFLPKRYYLSHFAFVLAVLSKQTALWLLPVYLVVWYQQGGAKTLLRGLTLQAIVFVLFYFPFTLSLNPFSLYLATLAGSSTLVSDQALNFWYFLFSGRRIEDSTLLLGISVRLWSLVLLAISGLSVCFWFWKKKMKAASALFWISIIAFFWQTRVHERHLAPAIAFLLVTDYPKKWKILFYFLLSAYYMYNLFISLRLPFI